MVVKLTGGSHLEIRTESVVQVTQTLAMSIEDFYATRETFLRNLAYVLDIDLSRLRIVNVVAGSTRRRGRSLQQTTNGDQINVEFEIGEDPTISNRTLAETIYDTSNNIDAESQSLFANMTAEERAIAYAETFGNQTILVETNVTQSSPGPDAAEQAAADLVGVMQTLQQVANNGTLQQSLQTLNITLLAMTVEPSLVAEPDADGSGSSFGGSTGGFTYNPYSPEADKPALSIIIPSVIGGVLAAAAIGAFSAYRVRKARASKAASVEETEQLKKPMSTSAFEHEAPPAARESATSLRSGSASDLVPELPSKVARVGPYKPSAAAGLSIEASLIHGQGQMGRVLHRQMSGPDEASLPSPSIRPDAFRNSLRPTRPTREGAVLDGIAHQSSSEFSTQQLTQPRLPGARRSTGDDLATVLPPAPLADLPPPPARRGAFLQVARYTRTPPDGSPTAAQALGQTVPDGLGSLPPLNHQQRRGPVGEGRTRSLSPRRGPDGAVQPTSQRRSSFILPGGADSPTGDADVSSGSWVSPQLTGTRANANRPRMNDAADNC